MNKVYHWKELKFIVDGLSATIEKLEKLEQKVAHLPHPAELGNSLIKINDKFEVVKLKDETGEKQVTYEGLVLQLSKYQKTFQIIFEKITAIDGYIGNLTLHTKNWEIVKKYFEDINIKYLIGAFKDTLQWIYQLQQDNKSWIQKVTWDQNIYLDHILTGYKNNNLFAQTIGVNQNKFWTDYSPAIKTYFDAHNGRINALWRVHRRDHKVWATKTFFSIDVNEKIHTTTVNADNDFINWELKAPITKEKDTQTIIDVRSNHNIFEIGGKFNELIVRHHQDDGRIIKYNTTWEKIIQKVQEPTPPSLKRILFSQEVLNIPRKVVGENGKEMLNPRIVENGNVIEVHELNDVIDNNNWVGSTFQFHFEYCAGKESSLHGDDYRYSVYRIVFIADKLPALDKHTWTKVYKMDYQVQWFLGNKGELKYEEFEDCSEGAPTVELKLETIGYYLKFTFNGFTRWWNSQTIGFKQKSVWDRFKIIADLYQQ